MNLSDKFVITINRELGSGGRTIGRELAQRLNVKYYDKVLVKALTVKFGISIEKIEEIKAAKSKWWEDFTNFYSRNYDIGSRSNENYEVTTGNIFKVESEILRSLADNESCVVAGRSGFHIFRSNPNLLRIFIQCGMEKRIARVMRKQNLSEKEAVKLINKISEGRENYIKRFCGTTRYDTRNYDLVLDVTHLSEQAAVDVIMEYIQTSVKTKSL